MHRASCCKAMTCAGIREHAGNSSGELLQKMTEQFTKMPLLFQNKEPAGKIQENNSKSFFFKFCENAKNAILNFGFTFELRHDPSSFEIYLRQNFIRRHPKV